MKRVDDFVWRGWQQSETKKSWVCGAHRFDRRAVMHERISGWNGVFKTNGYLRGQLMGTGDARGRSLTSTSVAAFSSVNGCGISRQL